MENSVKALKKLYQYKFTDAGTIAVVDECGNRKTTYKEFVTVINSIAYYLKSKNIGVGDVVAIELGRCMEHYAFRIACHFIGAVFLDMNPETPQKRKELIYSECSPKIIITEEVLSEVNIKDYECQINEKLKDTDLGYIIYTSGSTGNPKGILHDRSVYEVNNNFLKYVVRPNYCEKQIIKNYIHAALTDFSFIPSLRDMVFLFESGTVHIVAAKVIKDVFSLKSYMTENKIQSTITLPSLLKAILPIDSLIFACVAGEKSNIDFSSFSTKIFNDYGSSESNMMSFAPYGDNIIGEKFGDTTLMLRDIKSKKLIRKGENKTGEILFSGPDIMVEYINNPELTKETISYYNGKKVFHTKDIGRYTEDNHIQILGRMDSVVKVRGMRVNLFEIEYRLSQVDNIDEIAIKAFTENDETYICAYYSTSDKKPLEAEYLKEELRKNLNSYMIPAFFEFVQEFKRNEHGKLDRKALSKPKKNISGIKIKPQTQLEQILHTTICSILGIDENSLGVNTPLKSCGFNSLSAMKVSTLLTEKYNINLSATDLLQGISIANIAQKPDSYEPDLFHIFSKNPKDKKLVFVHPFSGGAESYLSFYKFLDNKVAFSCIEHYNFNYLNNRIRGNKNIANLYVNILKKFQPKGPYYLGGWSYGGNIAYEMACILKSQGEIVKKIYMIDSFYQERILDYSTKFKIIRENFLTDDEVSDGSKGLSDNFTHLYRQVELEQAIDILNYVPSNYDGEIFMFKSTVRDRFFDNVIAGYFLRNINHVDALDNGYKNFAKKIIIKEIPFKHRALMNDEPAQIIAKTIVDDMLSDKNAL